MFWCLTLFTLCLSEVIWFDGFDGNWTERWVISNHSDPKKQGEFTVEAPKKCLNRDQSKSLKTITDDAYYHISADIGRTISTVNKTFIFSYMVKCEQEDTRVGGAYIKLLSEKVDQSTFNGSTPYYLMFGWDIDRGHSKRVQAILRHKGQEYSHDPPLKLEKDTRTHLFTFILRPDYTYEIRFDNYPAQSGNVWQAFYGYIPPPTYPDPLAEKPADWCDLPYVPDPSAKKPRDWNDTMVIVDTHAQKPANWSEKYMGEWTQPRIPNPKYKGEWMPPVVKNPEYTGEWKRPHLPNTNWTNEKEHHGFRKLRYVGIDVFQNKAGTYWDNFFIADSMADYNRYVKKYWDPVFRYEGMYDPAEKAESFSLTGEDLFKSAPKPPKKTQDEEEEEEALLDIDDEDLWDALDELFPDELDDEDLDEINDKDDTTGSAHTDDPTKSEL